MKTYQRLYSDTGCGNGGSSISDLHVAWGLDVKHPGFLALCIRRTPVNWEIKVRIIHAKLRKSHNQAACFFKFRSVSLYNFKKCTKCEASVHLSADGAFRDSSHANITIR